MWVISLCVHLKNHKTYHSQHNLPTLQSDYSFVLNTGSLKNHKDTVTNNNAFGCSYMLNSMILDSLFHT
jgi:hypothetical protein